MPGTARRIREITALAVLVRAPGERGSPGSGAVPEEGGLAVLRSLSPECSRSVSFCSYFHRILKDFVPWCS